MLATVLGAAGLYVVICALFFFAQRAMVFPAPRGERPSPAAGTVVRGDGFRALDAPVADARGTVVLFHGNGEDVADAGAMIALWQGLRFSVFAVEYPGYGVARDLGSPSRKGILASADCALSWLRARGARDEVMVLQGQSLGTAVATEMARKGFGSRLVLISPFTSVMELGQRVVPWIPARLLVRDRFDTAAIAREVRQPVLIVHGTADEVVPVEMGTQLAREFPRAQLRLIPGAHHNDLLALHAAEIRAAIAAQF